MNLDLITPLILTYNEEANIGRTLAALTWAKRIVVVDSGSTDQTLEILGAHPGAEVIYREFDEFAAQCNFGLTRIRTPFTLSLDADHVLTPALVNELRGLEESGHAGWRVPFRYCMDGRPLRAGLLPPRVSLFRTSVGHYVQDGHAHRVQVDGEVGSLNGPLLHDDRKPISRWRESQRRYVRQEAEKLRTSPWKSLNWPDRLRLCYLGALLVPAYCLFWKHLFLDGWPGIRYVAQRTLVEAQLTMCLLKLSGAKEGQPN